MGTPERENGCTPTPFSHSDVLALSLRGICKRFPGVQALDRVDFTLQAGEIHALLGENGAGKSTLIKVLTGVLPRDAGEILLDGRPIAPRSPLHAQALGISTVYQEVNLIPHLSVAENLFLGRQPMRWGRIDWRQIRRRAADTLARLDLHVDVRQPLGAYSIAIQQMVALARAVDIEARVLILDEPTSSLDAAEVQRLFALLRRLKSEGLGVVFITHFLDQVYEISDRLTVLRNGARVGTFDTSAVPRLDLVAYMLGQERADGERANVGRQERENGGPAAPFPRIDVPTFPPASERPLLQAVGLGRRGKLRPVDVAVHPREVVGLAGLLGSGRTELARLLFGVDRADAGRIELDGRPALIHSARHAIRHGLGFCPEDRKTEGLVPELSVRENIALALQASKGWLPALSRPAQRQLAEHYIRALDIATPDAEKPVGQLSGGNQQKVILARWLAAEPRLLILDEPTRGIDVGAKVEIEKLIASLCRAGMAIVFISSELEEVVRASHRVVVLRDRAKVGELAGDEINLSAVMRLIAALDPEAATRVAARERENLETAPVPPPVPTFPRSHVPTPSVPTRSRARPTASPRRATGLLWPLTALLLLLAANLIFTPGFFHIAVKDGRLYGSLVDVLNRAAPVLLTSLGMTLVIATAGVDLSVGAVLALAGSVAALLATHTLAGAAPIIAATLGVCLLAGTWNGLLVARLGIQPIVATLVLMVAGRGIAQLLTGGQIITFDHATLAFIGRGEFCGLPFTVTIVTALFALTAMLLRFTAARLFIESSGNNETAARYAGVDVRTAKLLVYIFSGLCAGLAGLIVATDIQAADANSAGLYLELDAILAVVIGGTTLAGGRFSLFGTLVGALLIQTVTTTILTRGIPVQFTLVLKAIVVLVVCLLQSERLRSRWLRRRARA